MNARSSVIKPNDRRLPSNGGCRLDLRDIARGAEEVLAQARAQAARILADARRQTDLEREAAKESARRQGYEAGLAQGRETGSAEALAAAREQFARESAEAMQALRAVLAELTARRDALHLAARRDAVLLALTIAQRICSKLTEIDELAMDAAMTACGGVLELLGAASRVEIYVNPEDLAAIERLLPQGAAAGDGGRIVQIVPDPAVQRGGAVARTGEAVVDATVATRVERIADELLAGWRGRGGELGLTGGAPEPGTGPS